MPQVLTAAGQEGAGPVGQGEPDEEAAVPGPPELCGRPAGAAGRRLAAQLPLPGRGSLLPGQYRRSDWETPVCPRTAALYM